PGPPPGTAPCPRDPSCMDRLCRRGPARTPRTCDAASIGKSARRPERPSAALVAARTAGAGAPRGSSAPAPSRAWEPPDEPGDAAGAGGGRLWHGRGFFVQIERCAGIAGKVTSVRVDEDDYAARSERLREAVEALFEGKLEVDVVDVPTPYAMEVRVMPEGLRGRHLVGRDAECVGAHTVFSKLQCRKWPNTEHVLQELRDFCRVTVKIALIGKELKPAVTPQQRAASHEVHRRTPEGRAAEPAARDAADAPRRASAEDKPVPLPCIVFHCTHSGGQSFELHSDSAGACEALFYPGRYALRCDEQSRYERMSPSAIDVPVIFKTQRFTVTAVLKKKCTFFVVDHFGRPWGRFPLRLEQREGAGAGPLTLWTRVNGRGRVRLSRGTYAVSYDGGPEGSCLAPADWPVEAFEQVFEVKETEAPQFFRVSVRRLRFTCEVVLRTRFEDPVPHCPFKVTPPNSRQLVMAGSTNSIGVATCDLPAGSFVLRLAPSDQSAFVLSRVEVEVRDDGSFSPLQATIATKTVEVDFRLVTPDGRPAPDCDFALTARFPEDGGDGLSRLRTDDRGAVRARMQLLAPHEFVVARAATPTEYMPQSFTFQTDRREVACVVARSIFGGIAENNVLFLLDTSGSMQVYIEDVQAALNLVLIQQFRKSSKRFSVLSCTGRQVELFPELRDSSAQNLEDAMYFIERLTTGGQSNILDALRRAFGFEDLEGVYVVTDGKCEIGDALLHLVRSLHRKHRAKPRVNVVAINCVPDRLRWRALSAICAATRGEFRPVCLEQDVIDPVGMKVRAGEAVPAGDALGEGLAPPARCLIERPASADGTDEGDEEEGGGYSDGSFEDDDGHRDPATESSSSSGS
ncbi:unnamed protein product, partial [Prorocentrum cordatum]